MSDDNPTAEELAEYERLQSRRSGTPPPPQRPTENREAVAVTYGGRTVGVVSRRSETLEARLRRDRAWDAFMKAKGRTPENPEELDGWIAAGGDRG